MLGAFSKNKRETLLSKRAGDKNFNSRLDRATEEYESNLDKLNERTVASMKKTKEDYDAERREIISGNEKVMNRIIQEGTLARNKMNTAFQKKRTFFVMPIKKRKVHILEQSDRIKDNLLKNKNNEIEVVKSNFTRLSNDVKARNEKEQRRQNKEFTEKIEGMRKDQAQEIYGLKREFNEKITGGTGQERAKADQERTADAYEGRIFKFAPKNG